MLLDCLLGLSRECQVTIMFSFYFIASACFVCNVNNNHKSTLSYTDDNNVYKSIVICLACAAFFSQLDGSTLILSFLFQ